MVVFQRSSMTSSTRKNNVGSIEVLENLILSFFPLQIKGTYGNIIGIMITYPVLLPSAVEITEIQLICLICVADFGFCYCHLKLKISWENSQHLTATSHVNGWPIMHHRFFVRLSEAPLFSEDFWSSKSSGGLFSLRGSDNFCRIYTGISMAWAILFFTF